LTCQEALLRCCIRFDYSTAICELHNLRWFSVSTNICFSYENIIFRYIRRNQLDAGFPLFETESLKWPGFVEFDDVNGKVLTYSAQDGIYKVFDLKNYSFLYSIPDTNVQEIKISPGIMLLIYERTPCHVPLKILSIEDGRPLKSFTHLLHRNKKIDFIEQFNEKLLVKQEDENLQILDVRRSSCNLFFLFLLTCLTIYWYL
jgi:hypothetical protein